MTYVVPTMWRWPPFVDFLCDLVHNPWIGQIVIVDNDRGSRPAAPVLEHPMVQLVDPGHNIGVNPAWNLGVDLAQYPRVCVANDDIRFDTRVFRAVADRVTPDVGVTGIGVGLCDSYITDGAIRVVDWRPGINTFGFGQLFFVHKHSYTPIPDQLRIYFGDNYLFDKSIWSGRRIQVIQDLFYHSPYSVTTQSQRSQSLQCFLQEKEIYRDIIQQHGHIPTTWCPEHYG
jgi:hypothetical protein